MEVLRAQTLEEALAMRADRPQAVCLAGGTDVMVELNFGRLLPEVILDVSRLNELQAWGQDDGSVFLGAGVTYARITSGLVEFVPLCQASRSVGSPQIRNRGTVGGNLGTASPAGDALPVLAAYDAQVVLVSAARGERRLAWDQFLLGPKKTAISPDELIMGARWKPVRGPGSFSKVGTRNAMVISVVGLCLVMDEEGRRIRVALGSVAPTVVRARDAETFISAVLLEAKGWDDPTRAPSDAAVEEFAQRVAAAARPIDDVRGSAAYRTHACRILAGRALRWALAQRRKQP